jgi:peptide/nickel transport system ATP-binding protein
MSLVAVENLSVAFGAKRVVDGVSFSLDRGETLALVGESGSGKSLTALSLLQLLPAGGSNPTGRITLDGRAMIGADRATLRLARGALAGIVFQEPTTSLNPLHRIGRQVAEAIRLHRPLPASALRARVIEVLGHAGFADAEHRLDAFPHQLSGGQRQRVMIAMALANEPALLIADEPTTALDVTIQAQILDLMRALREQTGTAIILITHDLGVVAELADDVIVMYAGRVVERARVAELFAQPQHPYTIGLLGSIPRLDIEQNRLAAIEGQVPNPLAPISGCRFHPRCPFAIDRCRNEEPPAVDVGGGHEAACWRVPLNADATVAA